jgi:hypothetical protein
MGGKEGKGGTIGPLPLEVAFCGLANARGLKGDNPSSFLFLFLAFFGNPKNVSALATIEFFFTFYYGKGNWQLPLESGNHFGRGHLVWLILCYSTRYTQFRKAIHHLKA